MILLDVLIISIIVALLRGGKFRELTKIEFKRLEFIIIPFIFQYILVLAGEREIEWFSKWGSYLHLFSYVFLLIGIWYNKHIKAISIFGTGILINFIAILANKGQMPVSLWALKKAGMLNFLPLLTSKNYTIHTLLTSESKLKFLADIIPLPPPYPRPKVVSVGDVIMAVGVFFLIQRYMVKR